MKTPLQQAYKLLGRSQSIADYINIPTQINKDAVAKKIETHPNFKNYDHSLEVNRLSKLREKYNYVEPESDIVEIDDIIIEKTEKIDPLNVPNLSGLFYNNFNL